LPWQVPVSPQPQSHAAQQQTSQPCLPATPQGQASADARVETKADNTINIRKYMAILEETGFVKRNRNRAGSVAAISSAKRSRGCKELVLNESLQKPSTFPADRAEKDRRMPPVSHASR
jgi:hypothetical protein